MVIPFNQEELPDHLGYFTVTGSFLNALTQDPSNGIWSTYRRNFCRNPVPKVTPTYWAAPGIYLASDSPNENPWVVTKQIVTLTPYIFAAGHTQNIQVGSVISMQIKFRVDDQSTGYVRVSAHTRSTNVYHTSGRQIVPVTPNLEQVVTITFTSPDFITSGDLDLALVPCDAAGSAISRPAGFSMRAREPIYEAGSTVGTFFYGDTPRTDRLKNVWVSPIGNSYAIQSRFTSSSRINMLPISGTLKFKPSISTPITDSLLNTTLVPATITAYIDPNGKLIAPGDGKDSIPDSYDPYVRLLAPNQKYLSNKNWGWEIEAIPAPGTYWRGFKMFIGPEARPGAKIRLNESLVVDQDTTLRPERVFTVVSTDPPYPFGFDPERDSLLLVPSLQYWRV